MISRLRTCTMRGETLKRWTRTMGLPAQPLEDCVSRAAYRRTLVRPPAVIWFYSITDGDGRLQRLRPVLRVGL